MKRILLCAVLAATTLLACSPPPPTPAPAAPPYNTSLSLNQVMNWVIDPAADVVWESVAIIITEKGENQKAPKTDEEWAAVRNGAATLVEAGILLMLQGRVRDDKWNAAAKRMSDAGMVALQAAEKKDVAALFDSGAAIFNACSGCHARYRVGEEAPAAAVKAAPEAAPEKSAK